MSDIIIKIMLFFLSKTLVLNIFHYVNHFQDQLRVNVEMRHDHMFVCFTDFKRK
jgi:hypothetical protein